MEEGNICVKKVILFFARKDIQDEIKLSIYTILSKHKVKKSNFVILIF